MRKILYVASGFTGSTSHDRKAGLINAGWNLIHLDSDPWMHTPHRIWRGIHNRMHTGPLIWKFNEAIRSVAATNQTDIVWIEKGIWVLPRTVKALQALGSKVVHYTPDAAFSHHSTPNFANSLPLYDLAITSKIWEMDIYLEKGARRVFHVHQGTSPSRTRALTVTGLEKAYYCSEVVFVGHAEAHYVATILRLIELTPGINFKIWGPWRAIVDKYPQLKPYWQGTNVFGDDYAKALSNAKICIGLLSKLIPETETTRTFEIPACSAFLLAERTPSHESLYMEGTEAEFFNSPEEASCKIIFYLENEDKRKQIAQEGFRRFSESDYTSERFMRDCSREIEALLKS